MFKQTIIDRLSGLFFILLGTILYFYIIPSQVDVVDHSWMYPETLPNIISIALIILGAGLFYKPTQHVVDGKNSFAMGAMYFFLVVFGFFFIDAISFIIGAPIIALSLMLVMGERRIHWLLLGSVIMPCFIWAIVVYYFERALP